MAQKTERRVTAKQNADLIEKLNSFVAEGGSYCHAIHERHEENVKYYRGDQWSKADLEKMKRRSRPAATLNDVFKSVSAISNRELVERFVPKVLGNEPADNGIANVVDAACRWQRNRSFSEQYESAAFRSAIISGYGCAHKYWDPLANDGAGQIKDEDVPIYEMLWPAKARDMNLADRSWHLRGKWVDSDEAKALWGSANARMRRKFREIELRSSGKGGGEITDTSSYGHDAGEPGSGYAGFGWNYARAGGWVNTAKQEVFVVEGEWKEVEYVYRAAIPVRFFEWYEFKLAQVPINFDTGEVDEQTGEPVMQPLSFQEFAALPYEQQQQIEQAIIEETEIRLFETDKELNEFLDQYIEVFGREFELYERRGRTITRYAIRIDDEIAEYGVRPWGWSYHFITGFMAETREGLECFGAVDILKGPQDYKNALVSNLLAMYMHSPKGAMVFGKSVGDISKIADQAASPGAIIQVADEVVAQWDQKVKVMNPPTFPQTGADLLNIFSDGVLNSIGLSSISTGAQSDLRRVSGNVVSSARAAENTIVAQPFDALRMFRKQYGACNVKMLYRFYDMDDLLRIVGDEKGPDIETIDPEKWDEIVTFDITIDEQPSTPTEQMELAEMLTATGMLESWRQAGEISMEGVLKLLPAIPESVKRSILQDRGLQQQIAEAQSQTQQLQLMIQALYQFLQQMEGGEQILAQFLQSWQVQQSQQQIWSAPGSQPQGGAPLAQ